MEGELIISAADSWQRAPWTLDVAQAQGPDPLGALQKVVAADLRGLAHGETKGTLLLHPKGQFRALLAVGVWQGEVWLLAPQGHGGLAWDQLQRYLQFSRCHLSFWNGPCTVLVGSGWRSALQARDTLASEKPLQAPVFSETFTGLPGGVVLADVGREGGEADPQELELARIQAGFPAWGKELTADVLPQEVGLREPWVSLSKGCYVGQETMARLATYGHVNRLLVRLKAQKVGQPLEATGPLTLFFAGENSAKPVGRLTSWACSPRGELWALGLVHRTFAQEGQELHVDTVTFTVQAVLA